MIRITALLTSLFLAAAGLNAAAAGENDTVIFLHNAWFEKNKSGEAHPKFGAYDFAGIKAALAEGGMLEAPERGPNANPKQAAAALTAAIRRKIADGIDPGSIKVVGASKGAFIAQLASAALAEPKVSWVIVGGCHARRMAAGAPPSMTGRVLSIVDRSDSVAPPCAPHSRLFDRAAAFKEVELSTGLNHGFQFAADTGWIAPALAW